MSFKTTAVREKGISEGNSYAQVNGSLELVCRAWYKEFSFAKTIQIDTPIALFPLNDIFPRKIMNH